MVHGQPVAHTDSATFKRSAAGHANTGLDSIGDLAQPNVTGDITPMNGWLISRSVQPSARNSER
jgi:hypothetical protein